MKASLSKVALVVATAAVASCSTHDFSDKYGNGNSTGDDRKNLYTQKWIERYGLFDPKHDWTTLMSVDAEITGEYGDDIEVRIYNSNPKDGGHLIGFSRKPGRLELDLPKDATSVYAEISDGKGETLLAGEFDVALNSVSLSSSWAHAPQQSRSAHAVSYFDAMVVCEDLGGIGDYDFNDVVLGLRHVAGTNTLKIMPMAAGGTLHADVYYGDEHIGEIHELLSPGSDVSSMLNTRSYDKISKMNNVTVPDGFTLSKDWKNIRLVVKDKDNTVTITGPDKENEAPQMFCLGGDWYWPKETIPVDDAYPGFTAWTTSMLDAGWADAYSDISRVVVWDLTELKPNWFSGVTTDGKTYKARIGGKEVVDVETGEVYALDPPASLADMFKNCNTLTELDVTADHFDTSLANDMSNTFNGCTRLKNLDLSHWDTGNATTMNDMFNNCTALTDLNLSGMNTANVTDVSGMFSGCRSLNTLDISDWDISKVTDSENMFSGCSSLASVTMNRWLNTSAKSNLRIMIGTLPTSVKTLVMQDCDFTGTTDLGQENANGNYTGIFRDRWYLTSLDVTGWKTPDLTTLQEAFSGCIGLEDITGLNTWEIPNVVSLQGTFSGCKNLTSLDLSNWNTGNVTTMKNLFKGCTALTDINLGGMNMSNVTDVSTMFNGCSALASLDISGWDISKVTESKDMFSGCSRLASVTMSGWLNTSAKSNLQKMLGTLPTSVKTLVMQDCDFTGTTDLGQEDEKGNYIGIFKNRWYLTSLDVTGWKTPDLTTLQEAFSGCTGLEGITGLNTWEIPNVVSLQGTFSGCKNLTSLDLSNWNTGNVTTMKNLFKGCTALTDINLGGMNMSNVTDVSTMFNGCSALTSLDISGWDISKVTESKDIFSGCSRLASVTMNRWLNTSAKSNLQKILGTLPTSVKTLVMRDCDFTGTTDLGQVNADGKYIGVFKDRWYLTSLDVTGWKTPGLTTLKEAFSGCSGLEEITGINTWNIPNVVSLEGTFNNCNKLKSLDLSNWDTGNVTTMSNMFKTCKMLTELNLMGMNMSNVTDVSNMFSGCAALQSIDISRWNISKINNAEKIFDGCSKLTSAKMNELVNTSQQSCLRDIIAAFPTSVKTLEMRDCNLTGTADLGRVNENGTYIGLFQDRWFVTSLDVTGWEIPNLTTLKLMFKGCSGLETIPGVDGWDVSNVVSLESTFNSCKNLKSIDLSKWKTSKVTTMSSMFNSCIALTDLDLSGLNTAKVTDVSQMFNTCSALCNLNISGWDISSFSNVDNMFRTCPKLASVTMNSLVNSSETSCLRDIISQFATSVKTIEMRDCNFTGTTDLGKQDGTSYIGLFRDRWTMTSLDVSGWKMPDVTTLHDLFFGCNTIETINGIDTWVVPNVTSLEGTFHNCKKLKSLDLSRWKPSKVTTMKDLFNGCLVLQNLDLSGWDISNVTVFTNMFNQCPATMTIKCNSATQAILKSNATLPAKVQWEIVD